MAEGQTSGRLLGSGSNIIHWLWFAQEELLRGWFSIFSSEVQVLQYVILTSSFFRFPSPPLSSCRPSLPRLRFHTLSWIDWSALNSISLMVSLFHILPFNQCYLFTWSKWFSWFSLICPWSRFAEFIYEINEFIIISPVIHV